MIITLCGSLRFEDQFKVWDERLTLAGHTVFTVSVYPSDKNNEKQWYDDTTKAKLDAAHKRKIDVSDAILVIGDYIGVSTASEIQHALNSNKKIFYIYPVHNVMYHSRSQVVCPYAGCSDPITMRPPCALCYE